MEKTQKRDKIKNKWCEKYNIPLIRIPYWVIDNLTIDDLLLTSKYLLKKTERYQGGIQEDGED